GAPLGTVAGPLRQAVDGQLHETGVRCFDRRMDAAALHDILGTLWRMESPGLIARLARQLRDLDQAEDLVQDAWIAALEPRAGHGVPDNPAAWLTTTARNRAIDAIRQQRRIREKHEHWGPEETAPQAMTAPDDNQALEDDIGDDL